MCPYILPKYVGLLQHMWLFVINIWLSARTVTTNYILSGYLIRQKKHLCGFRAACCNVSDQCLLILINTHTQKIYIYIYNVCCLFWRLLLPRVLDVVGDVLFATKASSSYDLALVQLRDSLTEAVVPCMAQSYNPGLISILLSQNIFWGGMRGR